MTFDQHMMDVALAMACRGLGTTWPNPSVGAVVADEDAGEVIARGWTRSGGIPHAETEALALAGPRAQGKTLYVTLEPCSHFGRTPPCVDAVIKAGISRVVVAQADPDPRVSGRGLAQLAEAGVRVELGLRRDEAHWITLGHILRVTERRPFVQLKLALGRGGEVARGDGFQPSWVTGREARAHGHMLRAMSDAILVGAGTLRDDDPELTCRLPGLESRSPVRVVACSARHISRDMKLFERANDVPVWLAGGMRHEDDASLASLRKRTRPGVEVLPVLEVGGRVWLPALAEALVARGVTRLLVEGGPTMWQAFSKAGLVDEVVAFVGGGSNRDGNVSEAESVKMLTDRLPGLNLQLEETRRVGVDLMFKFRRN